MKGLDTNVLARYLLKDDPVQSLIATQWIRRECKPQSPGFINHVVLCELVWMLQKRLSRQQIVSILKELLHTTKFHIQNPELTWRALSAYEQHNHDIADTLIAAINLDHGCTVTATFDHHASRSAGFERVGRV